jgi:hypothetical protein
MNEPVRSGTWINKLFVIIGIMVLLAVLVLVSPLGMFVGISYSMHQIHKLEDRMQQPDICRTVATNLALYCQSIDVLKLKNYGGAAYLPPPIPQLGSPWAEFTSSNAFVEFGGGFYHYGYSLELDAAKSGAGNTVWQLYLCREESPDVLLHTCALPETARYPLALFLSNSLAEYDSRIKASPNDMELYKEKLNLLLQLDRSQVRPACTNYINLAPDHWWPRLTLALLDAGSGNFNDASTNLVRFVESHPSYSSYIYLAYFYQVTDKPDAAAKAVEKAISYPVVDLKDDQINTECRGYSAGVYLFQAGKYATVVKLCDVLLPVKINGNYAKAALSDLKSAANTALTGVTPAFKPSEAVLQFNPYENFNLTALVTP